MRVVNLQTGAPAGQGARVPGDDGLLAALRDACANWFRWVRKPRGRHSICGGPIVDEANYAIGPSNEARAVKALARWQVAGLQPFVVVRLHRRIHAGMTASVADGEFFGDDQTVAVDASAYT